MVNDLQWLPESDILQYNPIFDTLPEYKLHNSQRIWSERKDIVHQDIQLLNKKKTGTATLSGN